MTRRQRHSLNMNGFLENSALVETIHIMHSFLLFYFAPEATPNVISGWQATFQGQFLANQELNLIFFTVIKVSDMYTLVVYSVQFNKFMSSLFTFVKTWERSLIFS